MNTTGTLQTIDGRPALRFERRLPHPVERVWRAVSEPAELARWFVAPVHWTPAAGETFEAMGESGAITELDPPRALEWTWGDELFRFELRPDGDGCLLAFTHVLHDRALGAQHAAGWDSYLDRLDAVLAGGELSEHAAHVLEAARHERYAERFGLDPERGRRALAAMPGGGGLRLEDGPVLRFERRLDHPVERVWRALTEPAELGQWFPADAPLEVTASERPRRLEGRWFGDLLRFELRPDGDGCLLVFTHAFADRDTAARTAAGWDRCFARLDALLDGRPMDEAVALEAWPEVHERYAEGFEVDPELGRRAYAEHPLT